MTNANTTGFILFLAAVVALYMTRNKFINLAAFFIVLLAVCFVASNSIAIQCYNKCDSPKMNEEMPANKNYLVISLVTSLVLLLISLVIAYGAWMIRGIPIEEKIKQLIDQTSSLSKASVGDMFNAVKGTAGL
jgi:hypothetical protein